MPFAPSPVTKGGNLLWVARDAVALADDETGSSSPPLQFVHCGPGADPGGANV